MIPKTADKFFKQGGISRDLQRIREMVRSLRRHELTSIQAFPPGTIDPRERAKINLRIVQQTQLHRAIRLIAGATSQFVSGNIYGVALQIRALFESVAILGFFCSKLEKFGQQRINFHEIQKSIYLAASGARHELFKDAEPPVNIMTCIDQTDDYLDRNHFEKKQRMVRDCYQWLSEFSHPNFLSNQSAYRLEQDGRILFRHNDELAKEDYQLPGYAALGGEIFLILYKDFEKLIGDGSLDKADLGGPQWDPRKK